MNNQIIAERLKEYQLTTLESEENALKEILQEIALYALSSTDFFTNALFQGGTSLRILYKLPRFSEDLDFLLKEPNKKFRWQPYMEKISKTFELFNIQPEIIDRNEADQVIQKLFLKDNSIGKLINLHFNHHSHKKLMIKLEIDTNPPNGTHKEMKFLDFPMDYSIISQDLPSNFAGKCHALLCRTYLKGRDWFDFSWYVAKHVNVNLDFLSSAINQNGPWKKQGLKISHDWLRNELIQKIKSIDWKQAAQEVSRFLGPDQLPSLNVWGEAFFLHKVEQLKKK